MITMRICASTSDIFAPRRLVVHLGGSLYRHNCNMPATIECTAVAGDSWRQRSGCTATRGQEQAHPLDTVAQIQRLSRHLVFKPDRALCWHTSREGQGNREDLWWTRHCADKWYFSNWLLGGGCSEITRLRSIDLLNSLIFVTAVVQREAVE